MRFGNDLKTRRVQRGLTQSELADELGVHQATVSKWESGVLPDVARQELLEQIADFLGVSLGRFLHQYWTVRSYDPAGTPHGIFDDAERGEALEDRVAVLEAGTAEIRTRLEALVQAVQALESLVEGQADV